MATVKLTAANAKRFEALKKKYESKSLRKKDWDMMFNIVFEGISDAQWDKMIEAHIPDDVLIRQALSNPEFKKNVADYIRKNSKKPKAPESEKAQSAHAAEPVQQKTAKAS